MLTKNRSRIAWWVAACLAGSAYGAQWQTVAERGSAQASGEVRASQYRVVTVAADYLAGLYQGQSRLELPLPEGGSVTYTLTAYDLMPPELAARYPEIRTFKGQGVADPAQSGRFDIGPNGFHGIFSYQGRLIYVDPLSDGRYAVYDQRDADSRLEAQADKLIGSAKRNLAARQTLNEGSELRTYTIAISTSGEYAQHFEGEKSKSVVMASISTLLNRVNEVYQRDLGLEFRLVNNNDYLVYLDPQTDPFSNTDSDMQTNIQVQRDAFTSGKIDAYDIGHVINTGGGGLAYLGVLCNGDEKAGGMTGLANPEGDAFYVDYVAHEIGHQMGADHTFNGTTGSCGGGNRVAEQAWEPGSGSTIMAYAGICADDTNDENLQSNSDPYFHSKSIEQIRAHIATVPNCGTAVTTGNRPPVVAAGADYIIPARTAFTLKGSGSDPDGNALTYTWEQIDLGNESQSADSMIDDGTRPLFRFIPPTAVAQRTLPALSTLPDGPLVKGEAWPTTSRTLHFRLTARDGVGGVSSDESEVEVIGNLGPFAVVPPQSSSLTAGASTTVTWSVAGTDQPPVSCSKVDIALTLDEGSSWQTLASAVPNSGSASVTMPAAMTSPARIKVACSDNIFFAVTPRLAAVDDDGSNLGPGLPDENPELNIGGGGGSFGLFGLLMAGGLWWRRRTR